MKKKKKGLYLSYKNYRLLLTKKKKIFIRNNNLIFFPFLKNKIIFIYNGKNYNNNKFNLHLTQLIFSKLNCYVRTKITGSRIHLKKK